MRTWRGLCYSLETAQQKARWASFLGLGTSPISALTHDGLAFVKGLPQSVYYPRMHSAFGKKFRKKQVTTPASHVHWHVLCGLSLWD